MPHVNISTASSGNTALVSAVADARIKVHALFVIGTGAVTVYFNDGTADLMGDASNGQPLGSGTGYSLDFNQAGWFVTAAVNRALNINLSAAVGVSGALYYELVYS